MSTEGESGYLDAVTPSSSFDGPVPNSIGNTDCSVDNQGLSGETGSLAGGAPGSFASTGAASDQADTLVDGVSKEMDNLVPDGSNTAAKIKKPRRSEEYLIILCMLGRDICMLTALLVN